MDCSLVPCDSQLGGPFRHSHRLRRVHIDVCISSESEVLGNVRGQRSPTKRATPSKSDSGRTAATRPWKVPSIVRVKEKYIGVPLQCAASAGANVRVFFSGNVLCFLSSLVDSAPAAYVLVGQ